MGVHLDGRTILVVEDEYVIAADLAKEFVRAGAAVVGPVGSLAQAMTLVESGRTIDLAVLDIRLRDRTVYPLADRLRDQGVPIVFATGYDGSVIPGAYAEVPRLEKPVTARALHAVLLQMLPPADGAPIASVQG